MALAGIALLASGGTAMAGDFPHGTLSLPIGTAEAELHVAGDFAVLTMRSPEGDVVPLRSVSDVDDALAILADRRLAFAWPALLAWAGDDLVLLRDRAVARSQMAAEAGMLAAPPAGQGERWSGDPGVSAQLHYARALVDAGRSPAAIAFLRERIAATPDDPASASKRIFLTIRLANVLFGGGDVAAAVSTLDAAQRDHGLDGDFKLNIDVNLAMLLARSHQSQRALMMINDTWRQFDAEAGEGEGYLKVPSSEANFAWIRACALDGLGDHAKARALIAGIGPSPVWPAQDKVVTEARISAFLCIGDVDGLAAELAAQLDAAPPAGDVFISLQAISYGLASDTALVAAALRRPILARAVAAHARLLSAALTPAVAHWREVAPSAPPRPAPRHRFAGLKATN